MRVLLKKKLLRIAAALAWSASFAMASANASDVDLLLELLVKKQLVSQEEAAALRADIQKEKAAAGASLVAQQAPPVPSKEPPVTGTTPIKLSGWVQTRWTDAAGTTNPLELRRARVLVAGNLAPKWAYRVQADLVRSPALLDARVDYNFAPWARFSAGQFKIPFSQENLISSRDMIPIERSLVGNSLVPGRDNASNGRDIGAQLEGDFLRVGSQPLLGYSLAVFQGAGTNRRDDNRRKDVALRLTLRLLPGLSLIGNYYDGASGSDSIPKDRAGAELAYVQKAYSFRGEYIWGRDGVVHKRGGYALVSYRLLPKWEALLRFDRYEPNRQQRTDTYLLGWNWYFSQWVKWQANYGVVDDNARTDRTQTVLTQMQFQF